MSTLRLIAAVAVGAALAMSSYAATNPLHPMYFVKQGEAAGWVGSKNSPVDRYVDNRNPLHPSYAVSASDAGWTETGKTGQVAYIDINNPLHPLFQR